MDAVLVLRKLTTLLEHVARMERRLPPELDQFRRDVDLQDAVAMSYLVAVQEAADVALHMAADEGWGIPASYADSFELLASRHVMEPGLATELGNMARLRNRIAHGYASVDMTRIFSELPAGISALKAFASAIAQRLA